MIATRRNHANKSGAHKQMTTESKEGSVSVNAEAFLKAAIYRVQRKQNNRPLVFSADDVCKFSDFKIFDPVPSLEDAVSVSYKLASTLPKPTRDNVKQLLERVFVDWDNVDFAASCLGMFG